MSTGEAAGAAAAIAVKSGTTVRDVDIGAVQQALRNQGVLLDIAEGARIA